LLNVCLFEVAEIPFVGRIMICFDNVSSKNMRVAIGEKLQQFFGEGGLSDKVILVDELLDMHGIESFRTALPWRIILDAREIVGESEDLPSGLVDIRNQLINLKEVLPEDTIIKLEVDKDRLTRVESFEKRGAYGR